MTYILLLALLFSGVIATTIGNNPLSGLVAKIQGNFSGFVFPKNSKEIIIDNVEKEYQILEEFFSGPANELIKSKNIPEQNKKQIMNAFRAFTETKKLITDLKQKESEEKGILESVTEKLLKLGDSSEPGPTSIPPNCELVCPKK